MKFKEPRGSRMPAARRAAMAAAVGAAFAGAAGAAGAVSALNTYTIVGMGASNTQFALTNLITGKYCNGAPDAVYYGNGTAVPANGTYGTDTVFRIQCTGIVGSNFSKPVDISFDATGGSWKAFLATNPSLVTLAQTTANATPAVSINTGACSGPKGTFTLANGVTIAYSGGCQLYTLNPAAYPSTDTVTYGLTDVEAQLFETTTANQPLVNGTWLTTSPRGIYSSFSTNYTNEYTTTTNGITFPIQVFAVVVGVAASPALYSALQADQIAASLLPGTCVVGTISQTCAPSISRSQYASIMGHYGGKLNGSANLLFANPARYGGPIELARLNQGAGTSVSSNAYFLGVGCNATTEGAVGALLPGTANPWVLYKTSVNQVVAELNVPTKTPYAIGLVSTERDNGKNLTTGGGWLKMNGVYPSAANAQIGAYNYVTEENVHFAANPSPPDTETFATDISDPDSAYSFFNFTSIGEVPINSTPIVGGTTGIPANTAYLWSNGGEICAGWVDAY